MKPAPLLWNALGLALAGLAYAAGFALPHVAVLAAFALVYGRGLWWVARGTRDDLEHAYRQIAYTGLAGTVLGLILGLGGVDPSAANTPAAAATFIGTMLLGLAHSLKSTLLGVVLVMWLGETERLQGRA